MLVRTEEQFREAVDEIATRSLVAVDTEGDYIDLDSMIGVSVSVRNPDKSWYFPFKHVIGEMSRMLGETNLSMTYFYRLCDALDREDLHLIFHNAKHDLRVFHFAGRPLTKCRLYCTQIMSHMRDENGTHALKALSDILFGADSSAEKKYLDKLRKTMPWAEIPPFIMEGYACQDTNLTFNLFDYLIIELRQQELLPLWDKEEEFLRMLMEIEILGVKINQERAQELAVSARKEMGILVDRLGFDVGKKAELAHRLYAPKKDGGLGFSLQGVPLSKLSSKEFGTMPVMDKHVLAQYDHPVTADVLQYRGLQKAESTWFQGFLDKLWPDGRLHPNYRQDGTVTTRLSCAGPNMQQLPRVREEEIEQNVTKKLVKTMLDVDPSYELWGYDYSQLEYRIAAVYSKEKVLIDAYKSGSDFHRVSQEKFGLDRPSAKILNFSILYGAGGARVGAQLGIGASAGVELVKEFWGQYPKLAKVVKECEMLGLSRGWVRLYTGRKRHFRYPSECRKAFNSVVQGGAAEIVKESMLRVRRAGFKRTVGQVHDEIWYEFDKGADHSEFVKLLEWPEERFLIPFTVEGHKIAG